METIRQIKSGLTYAQVQQGRDLTEVEAQEVIARLVRQHRESIALFTQGNRQELAQKEQQELKVLLSYLPEQMTAEQLRELAMRVAREVGARGPGDKGKVMGRLMPQVKGKAEGKAVNDIVSEVLAALTG